MAHNRGAAILVVLATVAAGCAGTNGTDAVLGSGDEAASGAYDPANRTQFLRLDGVTGNSTLYANGTFETGANCDPASCGARTDLYDVTDRVSATVPTLIRATLDVDGETADPTAAVQLSLRSGDARVIQNTWTETDQRTSMVAVLLRNEEPIRLDVVDVSFARSQDVSYTLVAEFTVDPTLMFRAAPVEATLAANQTVSVLPALELADDPSSAAAVEVVVYDPEERLIAREAGSGVEITVPADAPTGAYVLLVTGGSTPVRFETHGTEDPIRLVSFKTEEGERHDVAGQGTASWDFTLREVPLSVGVSVAYEGGQVSTTEDSTLRLVGPQGPLIDAAPGCPGCYSWGATSTYSYGTPYGDERVTVGDYTVEYESGKASPTSVYEFTVWFDR